MLNPSGGHYRVLDIAERSGYSFDVVPRGAAVLLEHGLLEELAATQ